MPLWLQVAWGSGLPPSGHAAREATLSSSILPPREAGAPNQALGSPSPTYSPICLPLPAPLRLLQSSQQNLPGRTSFLGVCCLDCSLMNCPRV